MEFRIRRCTNLAIIQRLDADIFVEDETLEQATLRDSVWWVAYHEGKPVAYGGVQPVDDGYGVYLSRCGVLKDYRGHGLQRRLIRVRLRHAKSIGAKAAITYTALFNSASSNNLIRCGFMLYRSEWAWAGAQFLYWRLML